MREKNKYETHSDICICMHIIVSVSAVWLSVACARASRLTVRYDG